MKHDYCVACGNTENLHQHHLVPRSISGDNSDKNFITLCAVCHGKIHGADISLITLASKTREIRKSKNLKICNHAVYGKMFDGVNIIDNTKEVEVINKIVKLAKSGLFAPTITKILNSEGHRNRAGKEFGYQSVRRIMEKKGFKKHHEIGRDIKHRRQLEQLKAVNKV